MNKYKLKYVLSKLDAIDLSKLLIIFDIDGVLLRPVNNYNQFSPISANSYEFSPILTNLFDIISSKNIKYSIVFYTNLWNDNFSLCNCHIFVS